MNVKNYSKYCLFSISLFLCGSCLQSEWAYCQINRLVFTGDSTSTVHNLKRTYIRFGMGISNYKTIPSDYYYPIKPKNTQLYNVAAGIDLPGFWRGFINRFEIGYVHSSILQGEGEVFRGNHSLVFNDLNSKNIGYPFEILSSPLYEVGRQYNKSVMGSLRFTFLVLYPFTISQAEGLFLYGGLGATLSTVVYYVSNWEYVYPIETVRNNSRVGDIESLILSIPIRIGISVKSRLRMELEYFKDKIEENGAKTLSRRTLSLSCGYTLK
ncbi:hypothetical protein [Chitinophaga tropicalis]|uniref:Outer membrane protein beta-barrel domain-containing protein n=1 Tax=Chitinophaga tropicalis TaxID=2683588 RepID=A0A7K1UDN5_9BACT|nr:hypothetical protein [Chitinophaga tropicalis]MVT12499.1 hypothetical protein [Chitinophaga tropicalis]